MNTPKPAQFAMNAVLGFVYWMTAYIVLYIPIYPFVDGTRNETPMLQTLAWTAVIIVGVTIWKRHKFYLITETPIKRGL
jgi:hypothetical protein